MNLTALSYTTRLLTLILLFAFANANANDDNVSIGRSAKQTFVIVHGATGGGWDWKNVAQILEQQGHKVYRPTLSGLGASHHLAKFDINLTTHINDVVNLIKFEQLNRVVLVGHSYGGMVITGVMNQIPERLSHVTFLDAGVPEDGASALDTWGAAFRDLDVKGNLVYFSWLDDKAVEPKDVPHPYGTLVEPVSFNNPQALTLNTSYVAFIPQEMNKDERAKDSSWLLAKKRGWTIRTFEGDHTVYRVKPKAFVDMLLTTLLDENQ
jgi:pimeloyl-ACP methyl ester carboxylesterase